MRTITVKGMGSVSARPGYIILSLNIEALSETYDRAMSEAADRIERLQGAAVRVGYRKEDLKTTSFDVQTRYENVKDKRPGSVLQRLEYCDRCSVCLWIATHLIDQNLILLVMQREADRPPVQEIFRKSFLPRAVMCRRQTDRKLHPNWGCSVEKHSFQLIRNCKERQHKEALVLCLVPTVWNPLVGERIIPPLIGQRFAAKWPYLAAYQSIRERRMVDRFYLFVSMVPVLLLYVWSTAGSTKNEPVLFFRTGSHT